ncbi:MAG: helix-turn-helix domain-containing protein [Acidimicrobiia bacterium]
MIIDEAPEVLTVPEVAQVLRIGRNAAYQLVREGVIPHVRLGKTIRVPKAALLRYLGLDPPEQGNGPGQGAAPSPPAV